MSAERQHTELAGAGQWSPAQARARIRAGLDAPTAGWADGFTQTNLVVLPGDWAQEFLLFCKRNPKPCPVLEVGDPGSVRSTLAPGADLRTDLPRYRVWRDGVPVAEPSEVHDYWRDDLVAIQLGCSFTFEAGLRDAGIPLRHLEQGRNVAMYRTNRACRPAGRLSGPLVVSMRPIPAGRVAEAVTISARTPQVHGAPIHIGSPESLLCNDIDNPDFGDSVQFEPGDVPVFWACGVTPQAALTASRPPFAITHAPGHMFITDLAESALRG